MCLRQVGEELVRNGSQLAEWNSDCLEALDPWLKDAAIFLGFVQEPVKRDHQVRQTGF